MNSKKGSPLRVPVTHGLKDVYAMDMHLAYQAAINGHFNVVAFSRLASALSVILSALTQQQTKMPDAIQVLNSAVDTLQNVRNRGDTTGIWAIREFELPVVRDGIEIAERCIGTLTVSLLEQTAEMLLQQLYGDQKAS